MSFPLSRWESGLYSRYTVVSSKPTFTKQIAAGLCTYHKLKGCQYKETQRNRKLRKKILIFVNEGADAYL